MANEPDSTNVDGGSSNPNTPDNQTSAFTPRPTLERGFEAYTHSQASYPASERGYPPLPVSRKSYAATQADSSPHSLELHNPPPDKPRKHLLSWLVPWRTREKTLAKKLVQKPEQVPPLSPAESAVPGLNSRYSLQGAERRVVGHQPHRFDSAYPEGLHPGESTFPEGTFPGRAFTEGLPTERLPAEAIPAEGQQALTPPDWTPSWPPSELPSPVPSPAPKLWERQPYAFIAHFLLASGAITIAWLFGILAAQILPGRFSAPPLQESFLRKSSRLTHRLWHFSQLWHTPTTQFRIDAVPLPETGPVLESVVLSPIERQPLIDELNAVETEILTLDRRLQTLEQRLGKSPYQGTGIENRINTLRTAIDPPVRDAAAPQPYEPIARKPGDTLLDVAKLAITLPGDALFVPGEANLKDAALLEHVLDQLVNYPEATVSVRVHSDDQAGAIASREYTLAQANTLARYLQQSLPTSHRWITVGMGSTQPITDSADAVERQRNRRIEIWVDTR